MNYAGFDMYAHNRGTRRFSRNTRADLVSAQPIDCPFCGKATTANGGSLAEHSERLWPGRCPVSGYSVDEARRMAQRLNADFMLPGECSLDY